MSTGPGTGPAPCTNSTPCPSGQPSSSTKKMDPDDSGSPPSANTPKPTCRGSKCFPSTCKAASSLSPAAEVSTTKPTTTTTTWSPTPSPPKPNRCHGDQPNLRERTPRIARRSFTFRFPRLHTVATPGPARPADATTETPKFLFVYLRIRGSDQEGRTVNPLRHRPSRRPHLPHRPHRAALTAAATALTALTALTVPALPTHRALAATKQAVSVVSPAGLARLSTNIASVA